VVGRERSEGREIHLSFSVSCSAVGEKPRTHPSVPKITNHDWGEKKHTKNTQSSCCPTHNTTTAGTTRPRREQHDHGGNNTTTAGTTRPRREQSVPSTNAARRGRRDHAAFSPPTRRPSRYRGDLNSRRAGQAKNARTQNDVARIFVI